MLLLFACLHILFLYFTLLIFSTMSNEYEMSADDYKEISALPGNSVCIDCGKIE